MKITKDINVFRFLELQTEGLTLDLMYILELIDMGKALTGLDLEVFFTHLRDLGLLDEDDNITLDGKKTLDRMYDKSRNKRLKSVEKEYDPDFLEWWEKYPRSGTHGKFLDTRTFRVKKDSCHKKYVELKKKYTHQKLMDILEYEIQARVDQSYIRGENQLKFMRSTEPYLNDIENIEKYLVLLKKGPYKPKRQEKKSTDKSTVTI